MHLMRMNLHSATTGLLLAVSVMSVSADIIIENPSGGYDVNLYETLDGSPPPAYGGTGTPSEVGPAIRMPIALVPGYLVLLSQGDPNNPADYGNRNLWSDVVQFKFKSVQLFSCSNGVVPAYFPTVEQVTNASSYAFILETAVAPTPYSVSWQVGLDYRTNNYFVFSDDPVVVPEPSQIASGALVLMGVAGYAVRHVRRRRQIKV
jgi:hypothetical protein